MKENSFISFIFTFSPKKSFQKWRISIFNPKNRVFTAKNRVFPLKKFPSFSKIKMKEMKENADLCAILKSYIQNCMSVDPKLQSWQLEYLLLQTRDMYLPEFCKHVYWALYIVFPQVLNNRGMYRGILAWRHWQHTWSEDVGGFHVYVDTALRVLPGAPRP